MSSSDISDIEDGENFLSTSTSTPTVKLPFILQGKFFKVIKEIGGKITAKCQKCIVGKGTLSGSVTSTGNYIRHLKQQHEHDYKQFIKKQGFLRTSMKPVRNQPKITDINKRPTVSKYKATALICSYIIDEMRPIVTVEKPTFRCLIQGLSNITPPCRQTVHKQIKLIEHIKKETIKEKLGEASYVCTTADIWSSHNRSFLGVTAHIILSDTMKRKSFLLACRRMKYTHDYLTIAKGLLDIHQEYNLKVPKLVATVTDNAGNFGKSFRIFAVPENLLPEELDFLNDPVQAETEITSIPDNLAYYTCDDYTSSTDCDDEYLPKNIKCSAHTLNLLATTDASKALQNQSYKRIYDSAFKKACNLWNLCSRSTKVSDIVSDVCSMKLTVPCPTRWNSTYDSLVKLLSIKDCLSDLCTKLDIPKFKVTDIDFLVEFVKVTEPLASAIDILQGENNCYFGLVLPTILQLRETFSKNGSNLKYCSALNTELLKGLQVRFCDIIDIENSLCKWYILATISHPKFKLRWTSLLNDSGNSKTEFCRSLFFQEAEIMFQKLRSATDVHNDEAQSDGELPFFNFTPVQQSRDENTSKMECLTYLGDPEKDLTMLGKYPIVKELFLCYNTIIPSSAPIERAFSMGGQILTPRRNRLSDDTFERHLFCKYNE